MEIEGRSEVKVRSTSLTDDVLVEILSRLSVKSLLRFMCVSKEWHALIKSSYFTTIHLERSDRKLSLVFKSKLTKDGYEFAMSLLRNESTPNLSLDLSFLDCTIWSFRISIRVVGSSNGLVCLSLFQYIVVWNPATKQFRFLPNKTAYHRLLGFEFIQDISDYKLVSILLHDDNIFRAKVFTRRSNCWREVKSHCCSPLGVVCVGFSSITLTGVLYSPLQIEHRVSHLNDKTSRDEVFHVIPLPESISRTSALFSWKNSLAFLGGHEQEPDCELWMMTEEPSATTRMPWVKQLILKPSSLSRYIFGSWKDECLLWRDTNDEDLHFYDPTSQKLTKLPQHDQTHGYRYDQAINYVESLVSVD
ncbi:putative F-box/kelch-repeat protein At1g12870 [Rosa rugosa]|uniref:putative F-box/kelch-repeat protein At1g12870 n=1 Tax=Rosa rugosa TaxID=74645 RepID=UPI002B405566|nr:putative F-box/kelch-repeat protein At1g12870 [Rosa rugosa]